jgi:hypothetical protein
MGEILISRREKLKKSITDFHVLGVFMATKHDLSEKKSVRRRLRCKIKSVPRLQPPP